MKIKKNLLNHELFIEAMNAFDGLSYTQTYHFKVVCWDLLHITRVVKPCWNKANLYLLESRHNESTMTVCRILINDSTHNKNNWSSKYPQNGYIQWMMKPVPGRKRMLLTRCPICYHLIQLHLKRLWGIISPVCSHPLLSKLKVFEDKH